MVRPLSPLLGVIARGDFKNYRYTEHQVYCEECEDTGHVSIWHPDTVRDAMIDPDRTIWRKCAVLCTCDKIDVMGTHWPKKWNVANAGKPLPVFGDQPWHINARHPDAKAKAANYGHGRLIV